MKENFDHYWYTDIREIVTLKDMLAGSVEQYPKNPAFWVKEKKGQPYVPINYQLLQHDVNALGTKLTEMGLSGKRIAVMGQGCYEWIVTYLAVMNGVGVIVPIDKELSGPEIENLLRTAECDTIFCTKAECTKLKGITQIRNLGIMEFYGDRTDMDQVPEASDLDLPKYREWIQGEEANREVQVFAWRTLLREGELLLEQGDRTYLEAEVDPDALAVILFTSGTTGNPKGVMLCHRNITTNIMDVCRVAHVLTTDKTLSILPIHHTYECTLGMLLVLYRGASTAFCEGMKYITQNMKEAQNTVIIVVPRILEMINDRIQKGIEKSGKTNTFQNVMGVNKKLRKVGINLSRTIFKSIRNELGGKLRMVITGAAALSPEILRNFEDLGITVLQGFGMTECTPLISGTPMSAPKERYRKAGSVGVPVHSGEVQIVDKDEDGIGEILFRGPNVMMGYYNMPEATAEVLDSDGWLHTGDLGFQDEDGWIYLTGRKKYVIVTKTGENVYVEEIEDYINQSPYIAESMVFPYDNNGDEVVGVQILPDMEYVRSKLGYTPDYEELKALYKKVIQELNQGMAVYKRIRAVFVRKEDFVRTTTLKIKRHENPVPQE
ncbi:MAG: AMP-binding protein [Eubacteriales bacterium]|nr:AMP-binding protein [Eubacteriales bacterium]